MESQQLFLGAPVVIGFTAVRREDRSWTLTHRCVHEFQSWDAVPLEEFDRLSPAELYDVLGAILDGLAIL